MDKDRVIEIFTDAREAAAGLPDNLQAKGFELAVSLLAGGSGQSQRPGSKSQAAIGGEGGPLMLPAPPRAAIPDVSDLLKVCRQNPERYVVFLKDAEDRNEPGTVENLRQAFRTYRQDVPKLPNRDLDKLVANGWVEKLRNVSPLTFILKAKGRQVLDRLVAAVTSEG